MSRPTLYSLPYQDGRLIAASQCLAETDSHLWVVLAHYPNRGEWWATEGTYYCWLYNAGTGDYHAGISETLSHMAIDQYAQRLKQYVTRYLDGSKKNSEHDNIIG